MNQVEFEAEVFKETEKALLCNVEGEEIWIPKSIIGEISEIETEGDIGVVSIPEWFAKKSGLI